MTDFQNLTKILSRISNMESALYLLLEDAVKNRDLERIFVLTEFGQCNRGTSDLIGQLLTHLKKIEGSFEKLSEDDKKILRDLSESSETSILDAETKKSSVRKLEPSPSLALTSVPRGRKEEVKRAAWDALRSGKTKTAEIAKVIREKTGLSVNGRVVQGYRSTFKFHKITVPRPTEQTKIIREIIYDCLRENPKAPTKEIKVKVEAKTGLKITGRQINAWRTSFKRYERK